MCYQLTGSLVTKHAHSLSSHDTASFENARHNLVVYGKNDCCLTGVILCTASISHDCCQHFWIHCRLVALYRWCTDLKLRPFQLFAQTLALLSACQWKSRSLLACLREMSERISLHHFGTRLHASETVKLPTSGECFPASLLFA